MAIHNRPLTLMAVHAHPDDETVGTGGVLARAAAEGVYTVLVTATRGDEGKIRDPDLDPAEAQHRLAAIRQAELHRAAEILGIAEVHFLGYRDSGMAGTPENENPHNFHNADRDEATGRLVRLIRQTRPHVLIAYDETGSYGHPDHIAAHLVTVAAFDAAGDPARYPDDGLQAWQPLKLYYSAFARSKVRRFMEVLQKYGLEPPAGEEESEIDMDSIGVADERITTRIDVRDYVLQVRAALRAHRSQVADTHAFLNMPDDVARDLLGIETFVLARSLVPASVPEDDLFAGLRVREPAGVA